MVGGAAWGLRAGKVLTCVVFFGGGSVDFRQRSETVGDGILCFAPCVNRRLSVPIHQLCESWQRPFFENQQRDIAHTLIYRTCLAAHTNWERTDTLKLHTSH